MGHDNTERPGNRPWVTIREAAEHLSISEASTRRMVSRGELEARRIGKRNLRISRQSLETVGRPIGAN